MHKHGGLLERLLVQQFGSTIKSPMNFSKSSDFNMQNLIQTIRKIRFQCEKLFPEFIDLGYKLRETSMIPSLNIAIFICGTGTIGKLSLFDGTISTQNLAEIRLINFSVSTQFNKLLLIGKDLSNNSEKKSALVQVCLSNLVFTQKWFSNELLTQIFYCEDEQQIYALTEKGVFIANVWRDTSEIELSEVFLGQFSCFKYSQREWLLGEFIGRITRINVEGKKSTAEAFGEVRVLKYSRSGKIVIALIKNQIILYDLDLNHRKTVELRENPVGVMIDTQEKNIVVSTDKGHIVIASLFSEQIYYIPVHRDEIVHFWVNEETRIVYTFGKDSKMGTFHFPNIIDSRAEGFHALNFVFCGENPDLVFIESKSKVMRWNFLYGGHETMYETTFDLSRCLDYFKPKDLLLFSEIEKIILMTASTKTIVRIINLPIKIYINHIKFNQSGSYFFTLAAKNAFIYCYNTTENVFPLRLKGHEGKIFCQCNIKGTELIATGANDCKVLIWEYLKEKKLVALDGHKGPVICIKDTREGNKIISGSKDNTIKVWDWGNRQLVISLEAHSSAIVNIRVDHLNQMLTVSSEGTMIYWNLGAYVKIFKYNLNSEVIDFDLSDDYKWAAYTDLTGLKVIPFPTYTNVFDVIGPNNEDKYKYIYYLYKILKSDVSEYDPRWDEWAVLPYQFNTLLFYSYANLYKHLKLSIQNGSHLIPAPSADPYSIVAIKNYERCLKVFFESTKTVLDSNSHALSFISPNALIYMNKLGHPTLHTFYHSIFRKYPSDSFPKFIDKALLPRVNFSKSLYPLQSEFFTEDELESIKTFENFDEDTQFTDKYSLTRQNMNPSLMVPVLLFVSAIRIDLTNGCSQSIDFLKSILRCSNTDIFRTKYIQTILKVKWKGLRIYQLIQAFIYLFYLISLALYLIVLSQRVWGYIFLISIAAALLCFDFLQMYTSFALFWKDVWNYFDLLRSLLYCVYTYFYFFNKDILVLKELMTAICFLSFVRGVAFLRIFDDTRYLIQLILSIVIDIKSFGIILTYSTVSFSIVRMVQSGDNDFLEHLKHSIMVNLGEFGIDNVSWMGWIIFVIMGVINVIILLNMLIAIMGDTFTKVRMNAEIANYMEIAQMVLEIETIYVNKSFGERKTYLQLCEADASKDKSAEGAEKNMRKLKKYLKSVEKTKGK